MSARESSQRERTQFAVEVTGLHKSYGSTVVLVAGGRKRGTSPLCVISSCSVLIGIRAAVLAHQDEVGKWFSWPVEWPLLAELISARRLQRPGPGYLAVV